MNVKFSIAMNRKHPYHFDCYVEVFLVLEGKDHSQRIWEGLHQLVTIRVLWMMVLS